MKKIILFLFLISSVYANESGTKEPYDISEGLIYNGCKDSLADRWTKERSYTTGLMVGKKSATLHLLHLMSMRVVNGVDEKRVCKQFLDFANDSENSKYFQSEAKTRRVFNYLVEIDAVKNNGENHENFTENLKKIEKLFKN